ncbi:hypothetical protein, partial [Klebsiella pneumoniae]|uniref:hypothetical protein n=1 Tax=Klebsiella pneumoniae TaxID=573 RepID=UPI001A907803
PKNEKESLSRIKRVNPSFFFAKKKRSPKRKSLKNIFSSCKEKNMNEAKLYRNLKIITTFSGNIFDNK